MNTNRINIFDKTLCENLSFRKKLEAAKLLEQLGIDVIELPEIKDEKVDPLLIRTILSFVTKSKISVGATLQTLPSAMQTISGHDNAFLRIELPVSSTGMEYICHKKGKAMLELIGQTVSAAKSSCKYVEFCCLDATRAEEDFLISAINTALNNGADKIFLCDLAGEILPADFADFTSRIGKVCGTDFGISCSDKNGLALACTLSSGSNAVKTSYCGDITDTEKLLTTVKNCGESFGISSGTRFTELDRISEKIKQILSPEARNTVTAVVNTESEDICLDRYSSSADVASAASKLGYDLNERDTEKILAIVVSIAEKKTVGAKELDAIIANEASAVPETYHLENYSVHTGNIVSPSAQIILRRGEEILQDICIGDGPIDAAFLTLEKITGRHFELDDFSVQAVTEGHEAMGSAFIRLRSDGKLFPGTGISTDIIGASVLAYINAVNKILFEEERE